MRLGTFAPALAGAGLVTAGLAGCGGGNGGEAGMAATREAAAAVSDKVTVATRLPDGPVRNALVCLDANLNERCDAGEPQGRSDATGRVKLRVPAAQVGRFPLLAVVGTDAVDAVHGPVPTRYVLKAPADRAGLITPLTTLVQAHVEAAGATTAAAATFIRSQAALELPPLQDYTAGGTGAARAATLARLVVLTQQEQARVLQPAVVGQRDLSGATATQPQLDRVLRHALLGALPELGAAAGDPGLGLAPDSATYQGYLAYLARDVAAHDLNLDAPRALAAIGMAKLPSPASTDASQSGGSLRGFSFTGAGNWSYRAWTVSAADGAPDDDGFFHYLHFYTRAVAGTTTRWGFNLNPARRDDTHWNGQAWVSCPLGFRNAQTPYDATSRSSYDFCGRWELGTSVRSEVDISGRPLQGVIARQIRSFPGTYDGVDYSRWGPQDLSLLGKATFPEGSKLLYLKSVVTATAPTYDVQDSAVVTAYTAEVAAGGDARTGTPACGKVTSSNAASFRVRPATLEDLVALNPGKPCIFGLSVNSTGTSVSPDWWWNNSTASLGSLPDTVTPPAGTGNYYSTTALLRVAFGAGNSTRYYRCMQRSLDGSTRHCLPIGQGSYVIQTLGNARVMSFTRLPLLSQRMGWSRVFVERGGVVRLGYRNTAGAVTYQLRLNLTAANAVLRQLGVDPIVPQ